MSIRIFSCSLRIGSPPRKCQQYADGGARLMPGVLRDDRIHHTLQEQLARQNRDVVPDEYQLARTPGFDERLGNARRSGAYIVETDHVGMVVQQPHHEVF